jgi:hypothetical protein
MNIKLEDDIHETFTTAAKIIAERGGVSVPIPQLAEAIINAELAGMDAKKLARRFIKSITDRLSEVDTESDSNSEDKKEPIFGV